MIGHGSGRILRVLVVALGLGALFGVGALRAQLAMLSPEIRIAEKRWHRDYSPVLASHGEGRFAIAWCRDTFVADNYDGWWRPTRTSVWVRVFDESGVAVGPEVEVGGSAIESNCLPKIAMDARGRFFVVWTRALPDERRPFVVRWLARRFDRDGSPMAAELRLDGRRHLYDSPEIVMDSEGRFTIAWIGWRPPPEYTYIVRLQRFAAEGTALGPSFELEPEAGYYASEVSIAMAPSGRVIVASRARLPGPDWREAIAVRLLDADGRRVGDRTFVSSPASLGVGTPTAVADPSGGFWVAWRTYDDQLQGRRVDATGKPIGEVFEIASGPMSPFGRPALAPTATGLLALWPQPGGVDLTYFQALDSAGVRQGEAVPIAAEGTPVVGFVGVAKVYPDRSVLVWEKYYPHPRFAYRYVEVLARTFRP